MLLQPYFTVNQNNTGQIQPNEISGLVVWLESDTNVTTVSSNVSSWVDKTSSINYAQSTALNRPPYLTSDINGRSALNFTGSPITLAGGANSLLNNASGFTLFLVVRPNAVPGTNGQVFYISIGTAAGSARVALGLSTAQKYFCTLRRADADSASTLTSVSNFSTSNYQIVCVQYDASTRAGNIYINNPTTADVSSSTFGTIGTNFSATNPLQTSLGSSNASAYANARVADTLLFNRSLTAQERADMFSYLNTRFAIY